MALLLATTLVDGLIAAALVWLAHRIERLGARARTEHEAMRDRLRLEVGGLVVDAERRIRALDEALATREATLRVLLQIADASAPSAPGPHRDPSGVRLLRDLELRLAPHEPTRDACP